MSSILALLLAIVSACAPASQNSTTAEGTDDIIGGKVVAPGSQASKQVFMLYGMTTEGGYICTATLITPDHALTAAHCVDGVKKMFAVFAVDAVAQLKKGNPQNNPDIIQVSRVRAHELWGGSKGGKVSGIDAHDIAVVRLSKSAPSYMKVTKLHSAPLRKGQILVAAGYGIESGVLKTGSGLLRETTVKVEEPLVGKTEFYIDQTNGRGICSGDSGGPSFVQNSFGELVQVGVTSRGDETCENGGLYTLVPAFTNWINSTVRTLVK